MRPSRPIALVAASESSARPSAAVRKPEANPLGTALAASAILPVRVMFSSSGRLEMDGSCPYIVAA